jgi:hypothetical protein
MRTTAGVSGRHRHGLAGACTLEEELQAERVSTEHKHTCVARQTHVIFVVRHGCGGGGGVRSGERTWCAGEQADVRCRWAGTLLW